jgi:Squalene/phytoene synthase
MADFAHKAATTGLVYLESISEYDLYCHYVAGLVGEGLSRLWSASGKESPWLGSQLDLSNSMGILLQKTNIICDFREDVDTHRFFWPREIWGRYGFAEMAEMHAPGNEERAVGAERYDRRCDAARDRRARLPPPIHRTLTFGGPNVMMSEPDQGDSTLVRVYVPCDHCPAFSLRNTSLIGPSSSSSTSAVGFSD